MAFWGRGSFVCTLVHDAFIPRLFPRMRHILVLFILLSSTLAALALSEDELRAIEGLREAFHGLDTLQSRPWSSNASAACDPPYFYGLTCSEGPDPHVIKMYVRQYNCVLIFLLHWPPFPVLT